MLILEWGGSALKWPGGPIKYFAGWSPDRKARIGIDAWVLAQWQPPEFFLKGRTPEEAIANWEYYRYASEKDYRESGCPVGTDILGPPPRRGGYRACINGILVEENGQNIPINEMLLEEIRKSVGGTLEKPDPAFMNQSGREAMLEQEIREDVYAAVKANEELRMQNREMIKDTLDPMRRQFAQGSRPRQGIDGQFRRGSAFKQPADKQPENKKLIITPYD